MQRLLTTLPTKALTWKCQVEGCKSDPNPIRFKLDLINSDRILLYLIQIGLDRILLYFIRIGSSDPPSIRILFHMY